VLSYQIPWQLIGTLPSLRSRFLPDESNKRYKSKDIHGKPKLIQGTEPQAPNRTGLLCQEQGMHIFRGISIGLPPKWSNESSFVLIQVQRLDVFWERKLGSPISGDNDASSNN